jgi:hypothetical protein
MCFLLQGNHSEFLSLVSLSTDPPQVCHGAGQTTDASHDQVYCSVYLCIFLSVSIDAYFQFLYGFLSQSWWTSGPSLQSSTQNELAWLLYFYMRTEVIASQEQEWHVVQVWSVGCHVASCHLNIPALAYVHCNASLYVCVLFCFWTWLWVYLQWNLYPLFLYAFFPELSLIYLGPKKSPIWSVYYSIGWLFLEVSVPHMSFRIPGPYLLTVFWHDCFWEEKCQK